MNRFRTRRVQLQISPCPYKTVLVERSGECRFAGKWAGDTEVEDIEETRVLHLGFDEGPCPAGGANSTSFKSSRTAGRTSQ